MAVQRPLRIYLTACIAFAFAYLLWHSQEPLRTNIGDPWSDANVLCSIKYVKHYGFLKTSFTDILDVGPLTADSYRYIHYPPLSEIIYGAIGKLGASDIGTFRLFGIAFSGLAMWFLFQYARRMFNDRVALIATMLFTTSLLWLMYADSMHQAPVMQASAFIALWGLVRAIETTQRRHYVAFILGTFACCFASYDYWIFLPAAVLVTVYTKLGNPFGRGHRRFVALAAGACILAFVVKCLAVAGAVGWHELFADLHLQFLERSTSTYDRAFTSSTPTMLRRITLLFTPLVWISIAVHGWRALRAPSFATAIKDTALWMLLTALLFLYIFNQLAASQMLPSQVMLPFYSLGSALLIDRLLAGTKPRRVLGLAWLVAAPVWGFAIMVSHPRSVMARDEVAKVNAYLAQNDHNDFILSNLGSIGHIQAAFDRHYWATPAPRKASSAYLDLWSAFEVTGSDYAHAVIFTDTDSRFIDKSLWGFAMPKHQWSVTGWPYFVRAKTNRMINEYDKNVQTALRTLKATRIQHFSNFDLYRMDKATVMDALAHDVPAVTHVDFGSLTAGRNELLGWGAPHLLDPEQVAASPIAGYDTCVAPASDPGRSNRCKTVLTKLGLEVKNTVTAARGQLLVVPPATKDFDRACDLRIHIRLARPTVLSLSMNGFTAQAPLGHDVTFTVPASAVEPRVDLVTLENLLPLLGPAEVMVLDLEPACS